MHLILYPGSLKWPSLYLGRRPSDVCGYFAQSWSPSSRCLFRSCSDGRKVTNRDRSERRIHTVLDREFNWPCTGSQEGATSAKTSWDSRRTYGVGQREQSEDLQSILDAGRYFLSSLSTIFITLISWQVLTLQRILQLRFSILFFLELSSMFGVGPTYRGMEPIRRYIRVDCKLQLYQALELLPSAQATLLSMPIRWLDANSRP